MSEGGSAAWKYESLSFFRIIAAARFFDPPWLDRAMGL